ncbi:hypothetical protein [uncultured Christiangramia sp.]|uniref:hypothetical protein n=1 Tax=uncultured Christiangramia sp. TaxID=503836 RepID=UPI00260C2C60|nr:hypothetical protein [uncultured Christiangramia sp.]
MIRKGVIKRMTDEKSELIQIIIIAVLLGLAISIIANIIFSYLETDKNWLWAIGIFTLVVSILFLVYKVYKLKSYNNKLHGFILFDEEKQDVIQVNRYDYAFNLESNLTGAFNENEAIRKRWEKEPLNYMRTKSSFDKEAKIDSYSLIIQATEYYILKTLSTHLTDYFSQENIDQSKLEIYQRNDIPNLLLNNTFLELFSKPMNERIAFLEDSYDNEKGSGKLVSSVKNGVKYERFELKLPAKSKISKPQENVLIIDTSRFKLSFTIGFYGFNTVIGHAFKQYYLKFPNSDKLIDYDISIQVNVEFKLEGLINPAGWNYFTWLDSFVAKLDEKFSMDKFFEEINWSTAETMITLTNNIIDLKKNQQNSGA